MLKIGIVGAGGIAQRHVEGLLQIDGAKVVAVVDVERERAESTAAKCGARPAADMADILDLVDAVYICTPPTLHAVQAAAAARAGKHIFCEKPIATTMEDALTMARAVAAGGVRMMVGFNMRFRPPFRRLKEVAASGELGEVITYWTTRVGPGTPGEGNWRITPGLRCGMTIESVSHDVDLMRWICGEAIDVRGRVANSLPELDGYDDNMSAVMALAGGGSAVFHVSWSSHVGMNSRGVVGTKGTACLEGLSMWGLSRLTVRHADADSAGVTEFPDEEAGYMAYRDEGRHFVECLESGMPFLVTEADGVAALELSLAIHESSREGRVVKLPKSCG
ncbi:MAG: Gfo/Idh/MocA family protein [Planctomycetota bacterium]|jgi:myo-inositol 2-dehydrogenase/D-chiro-inositol 1-dehydrogenase